MCGIAGTAGYDNAHEAQSAVRSMLDTLARRGPDGEGIERWDDIVLGQRRLAIFDLSAAGRQPMLSPDGRTGVTFNGAIYNFKELRRDLQSRGYSFVSETDTEVLVHGYREWGMDALVRRLHGMFAFALWDDARQELYLVRDRLGVKPLLYARRAGRIAFASTARALRGAGLTGDLDEAAIAEFLEYGFITDERCIYAGVEKLPAAHIGCWTRTGFTTYEYWRPAAEPDQKPVAFEDAVRETERLFLDAVKMRLQADVPVGALLSGGIDSSLVCWGIAESGADVTAFTVSTPGDEWDESADARSTAHELGLKHQVLEITPESSSNVDDLVCAYGEPFACASALGMLDVSKAVRNEATVLLTGDGGDDVFLGYPRHRHFALAQGVARKLPAGIPSAWHGLRSVVPKVGPLRRASHFLDYATQGLAAVTHVHDGLPAYKQMGLLGDRMRDATVKARKFAPSIDAGKHVLSDFLEYERSTRFVSEYLTKVDGGTMYFSLEARSPFLDQKLWEFASSLPYDVRLHRGRLKAILRELARRKISDRVADGAKRGFGIPVQRWITGKWRAKVLEAFSGSVLHDAGIVNDARVAEYLNSLSANETAANQLWYLYVLESWLRKDSAPAGRYTAIA